MSLFSGCPRCLALRRFVLGLALGGTVVWQVTGAPPMGLGGETWRGLVVAALLFMLAVIGARLHQMRRRWRR